MYVFVCIRGTTYVGAKYMRSAVAFAEEKTKGREDNQYKC